jgi:hypothetical protein
VTLRSLPLVALLGWLAGLWMQTPASDPELERGLRQLKSGDLEGAVLTLDPLVRRLPTSPERLSQRARAHLYLGAAYAGLKHERLARAQFREALKLDKDLRPQPGELSAEAMSLFESARKGPSKKKAAAGAVGAIGGGTLAIIAQGAAVATGAAAAGGGATTTTVPPALTTTTTTTPTLPCPGPRAPVLAIVFPRNGMTVSGTVIVEATASDDAGVTEVRFYLDDRFLAFGSPVSPQAYQAFWDTRSAAAGAHSLSARAFDACRNQGFSAPVSVDVRN